MNKLISGKSKVEFFLEVLESCYSVQLTVIASVSNYATSLM